jgi:hypothetical protein
MTSDHRTQMLSGATRGVRGLTSDSQGARQLAEGRLPDMTLASDPAGEPSGVAPVTAGPRRNSSEQKFRRRGALAGRACNQRRRSGVTPTFTRPPALFRRGTRGRDARRTSAGAAFGASEALAEASAEMFPVT